MSESILNTIKKSLGISVEYEHFDSEIILYTNSVLLSLTQIGVGPENGFMIESAEETWDTFLGENRPDLDAVKTYISLKVKLIFDPPSTSFVLESMSRMVSEMEWRLGIQAEKVVTT